MDSVDVDDDDDDDDALEIFAILFSLKSLTHAQVFFFFPLFAWKKRFFGAFGEFLLCGAVAVYFLYGKCFGLGLAEHVVNEVSLN